MKKSQELPQYLPVSGEIVAENRRQHGWTQTEFARRIGAPMTRDIIAQQEIKPVVSDKWIPVFDRMFGGDAWRLPETRSPSVLSREIVSRAPLAQQEEIAELESVRLDLQRVVTALQRVDRRITQIERRLAFNS